MCSYRLRGHLLAATYEHPSCSAQTLSAYTFDFKAVLGSVSVAVSQIQQLSAVQEAFDLLADRFASPCCCGCDKSKFSCAWFGLKCTVTACMGPRQPSSVSFDSMYKAASCTLSSGCDGLSPASRVSQAHFFVFAELTFVAATPDDLH